jgi:nicotinate-nucleotide pyrophosphorylase (carboxylating)
LACLATPTGVDLISIGWLTHSAAVLDIGLDFDA